MTKDVDKRLWKEDDASRSSDLPLSIGGTFEETQGDSREGEYEKPELPSNNCSPKEMMIRKETSTDIQDIRRLNDLVFAGPVEGTIVDAIRDRCPDALSLVAVEGTQIIGHIFFSPVAINGMNGIEAMGLGPMAVLPEYQRKGIDYERHSRTRKSRVRRGGCSWPCRVLS